MVAVTGAASNSIGTASAETEHVVMHPASEITLAGSCLRKHTGAPSNAVATLATASGFAATPFFNLITMLGSIVPFSSKRKALAVNSIGFTQTLTMLQRFPECPAGYYVPGSRSQLTLTWPYVSPSLTVDLRVPKFGNADNVDTLAIVRRTLGDQLSIARGATWPTIEVQTYAFEGLTKAQRDALLSFCASAIGFEIGLLDHENRQWRGVMIDQPTIAQEGRGPYFGGSFSFRGSLA